MPGKNNYVTGSRKSDYAAFVIVLIFLLIGTYFLRVYYTVTVAEFDVVYVSPEGNRQKIDVAVPTKRYAPITISESPQKLFDFIQNRVKKYIASSGLSLNYLYRNPGARFELNIYYSRNSTKLDKKKVIVFDENSSF